MRYLIVFTLLFSGVTVIASAQYSVVDTFRFRVIEKTPVHPYYGMGDSIGFSVDGVEGGTIYMIRDSVYIFTHENMGPVEAPVLGTSARGVGFDNYPKGYFDDDHPNKIRYFRLPSDAPDTLYYVSSDYRWAGGMIIVVDSLTTSVREDSRHTIGQMVTGSSIVPNPVTTTATLLITLPRSIDVHVEVYDLLGRMVQSGSTHSGQSGPVEIPISREGLSGGMYFYRVLQDDGELLTTGSFHVR